jgi:hypothetical protein
LKTKPRVRCLQRGRSCRKAYPQPERLRPNLVTQARNSPDLSWLSCLISGGQANVGGYPYAPWPQMCSPAEPGASLRVRPQGFPQDFSSPPPGYPPCFFDSTMRSRFAGHARAAGEKGALAWIPETGRTIFYSYTLRAAETGGPLGRGADCRLPEGKSKRARLGGLSAFWEWL